MKTLKQIFITVLAVLAFLVVGRLASAQTVTAGSGAGSITIENASQGQTYTLYKLFDATRSANGGIAYKLPAGKSLGDNAFFTVGKNGEVQPKENLDVSTEAFKSWAESFGTEVTAADAADETVTFDGLEYGYYFIKSTLGTTITVDSTHPDATVKDKNTTEPNIPDVNAGGGKKISVNNQLVSQTTAKIGDTLDYQIKFTATNFITTAAGSSEQITSYTIDDTPSDLAIDESTVTVTVAGQKVNAQVTKAADGKVTIVLDWVSAAGKSIYKSPSEVVVSYQATVTEGAKDGQATNDATIGYNTKDKPSTGGNPPTPVVPKDPSDTQTTVNTYEFTLNKIDAVSKETLTGATFRLYDAATGGNEIAVVKEGDTYRVAKEGENGVDIEVGTAVIKGLKGDTTYYLEETKAPDGYNILKDRQSVTVSSKEKNTANVENRSGAELPSTGAMGTTLFYIAGTILLIAAAVYMISKRRMNNM